MASAPKLPASLKDPEQAGPSVFVPRGKTPPPEPTAVSVSSSKSPKQVADDVLSKAFGPISPSVKKASFGEKGGRKHHTRKHKKSSRKTKKHLRRK